MPALHATITRDIARTSPAKPVRRRMKCVRLSAIAAAISAWEPAFATAEQEPYSARTEDEIRLPVDRPLLAYSFDNRLLLGANLGIANVERFNRPNMVDPGSYRVDIFLNDVLIARQSVEFRADDSGAVHPCLSDEFLIANGVLIAGASVPKASADSASNDSSAREGDSPASTESSAQCAPIGQRISGAFTKFDLATLRLHVSVPQAMMKRSPQGYVDRASLDPGDTVAYVNYDANAYTSAPHGQQTSALYVGIDAGINLGLWRFRQQSNYSYNKGPSQSSGNWDNIRTYVERPIAGWNSRLMLGQGFAGNQLLSAVAFTGARIETDERMLPDSARGYAPVVNGVANSNARVVVKQNGHIIYQTTVAPGPFSINDLNPTSYQGDLLVEVQEANGEVSTFSVPFSAVPSSMRPGMSRYGATIGQVRQISNVDEKFVDLTYERGLSNLITGSGAVRVSPDYQSVVGGLTLGTFSGAYGMNLAWSNSLDPAGKRQQGWRGTLSYSHTIQPTQTNFSLAAYRYSTRGYRDFVDALSARAAAQNNTPWDSATYNQRDQFSLSVNQQLNGYGLLSLSGSMSNYYGSKSQDTQVQLSYSHQYKSISFNLSYIRQRTASQFDSRSPQWVASDTGNIAGTRISNVVMATVTIPLGSGSRAASVSGGLSFEPGQDTSLQASVSGVADEAQTLTYGLSASGHTGNSGASNVSGNLQKRLPRATLGINASGGKDFWQAGATARGALVAHRGGVTLGPYLSETFGIVEAKGAEGASVRYGMGSRIDGFGYALIPSLTPYRYNDIALDSKGIHRNAELATNQIRTAPYAGSAVRLKFETRTGRALLIATKHADGETPIPLGANVYDETNAAVGIVGQGSRIYARVSQEHGSLTVKWGANDADQCVIDYNVKAIDPTTLITQLEATCMPLANVTASAPRRAASLE